MIEFFYEWNIFERDGKQLFIIKSKFIILNLFVLLLYYQAVSVSECLLVIVLTGFF